MPAGREYSCFVQAISAVAISMRARAIGSLGITKNSLCLGGAFSATASDSDAVGARAPLCDSRVHDVPAVDTAPGAEPEGLPVLLHTHIDEGVLHQQPLAP